MAFLQSFLTSQTIGLPNIITLQDTSTGVDANITKRRIILTKSDNTTLVPSGVTTNYIDWALVDTTLDVNVLPQDYALNITVQWLNVANSVLYTKTVLSLFQLYENTFYYNLIQLQASTPVIINDENYWGNVSKLASYIDNAVQAVAIGGDIAAAQNAIDKGTELILHQNANF